MSYLACEKLEAQIFFLARNKTDYTPPSPAPLSNVLWDTDEGAILLGPCQSKEKEKNEEVLCVQIECGLDRVSGMEAVHLNVSYFSSSLIWFGSL